jgi:hypothetical protein
MAVKKKPYPKRRGKVASSKPGRRRATGRAPAGSHSDLEAMAERLDVMLPELIARVAAVEHLLVQKGLCTHEELINSRKFIDEQESW